MNHTLLSLLALGLVSLFGFYSFKKNAPKMVKIPVRPKQNGNKNKNAE